MSELTSKDKRNWNNAVKIIVALIGAGGVVAAAILPGYIKEAKTNGITIDSLVSENGSLKNQIQVLDQEIDRCKKQDSSVGGPPPVDTIEIQAQPITKIFGDYKIEPLEPFTGNSSDGTINFSFNITNNREDRTINLYTRNSLLIGEDNLTKEGESAQLSNSKVARPKGNTSAIKLMQNHPLKAYIKFKTIEKIKEVHEMSFYVSGQEIKYSGKYPIKWNE